MIDPLIQIKSIHREQPLDEVKEKGISHIEEDIIRIDLRPRVSSYPVHLSLVLMEKILRRIPLDPKESLRVPTIDRESPESMELESGILSHRITLSDLSEEGFLIHDLAPDDPRRESS